MENLRIVFMGTPDFAVGVLKTLIENNYNVVGVITAPDRPSGRGRKINQSAVKEFALQHKLPILQPTNLKDKSFLNELKQLNANLQVVVAFRMLPTVVWQLPKFGTFNLHASLLPQYRGAAPINWAIINGETSTGVTTFFIDEKIDTGNIILQDEIKITNTDTAGTLHDKLMESGSKLVIKTIEKIKNKEVTTIKQPKKEGKAAPKIFKETCKIDWNDNLDKIYNKIRGLSPYPTAWTTIKNGHEILEVKLYSVNKHKIKHTHPNGKIITTKKEMKIAVKDGYIIIDEIQLPSKRKIKVKDLLNGYAFYENAIAL